MPAILWLLAGWLIALVVPPQALFARFRGNA